MSDLNPPNGKSKAYSHLRQWHGFSNHINALKAAAWLGAVLFAAVVFGLDQRYASKDVESVALSTWEIIILGEIEHAKKMSCQDGISSDYRSELNRRLAARVAEYRDRKGSRPYVPDCHEVPMNGGR